MNNRIVIAMIVMLLATLLSGCPQRSGDNASAPPPPAEYRTFDSFSLYPGTAYLFTNAGGARVEIFYHGQSEQGAMFRMAVNDSGSGSATAAGTTGTTLQDGLLAYQGNDNTLIISYDVSTWSAAQINWRD